MRVIVQGLPKVVAKFGGGVIPVGAVRVYEGAGAGDILCTKIELGTVIIILPFCGIGFLSLIWTLTFNTWEVPGGSDVGVILVTVAASGPEVVI